jgi:Flp pilus assembly protein TadG
MLRSERGQNLVELALVMFFVLVPLLAGVADLGRAFYSYIAITNGAREGARYGARHFGQDPLNPSIEDIAVSEAMSCATLLTDCTASLTNCTAPPTTEADSDGKKMVRVTVSCELPTILLPGPFMLQNTAAMKVEGP